MCSNFLYVVLILAVFVNFNSRIDCIHASLVRPFQTACSYHKILLHNLIALNPEKHLQMNRNTFQSHFSHRRKRYIYRVLGTNAEESEFPHMAAIGWETTLSTYQYLCAGSLISDNFILSAAHCKYISKQHYPDLKYSNPTVAKLGQNDLNEPSTIVGIAAIISHDMYRSPKKYYDIALIKMADKVQFSSSIIPACLTLDVVNSGTVTGWGATKSGRLITSRPTNYLHKAEIEIVPNEYCDEALIHHNWNGTAEHQICAGDLRGTHRDSCQGDSGSPLQYRSEPGSVYHIVGVTAFGSKECGQHPAIYTKVSSFIPWIEKIVWAEAWTRYVSEMPRDQTQMLRTSKLIVEIDIDFVWHFNVGGLIN